MNKLFCLFFLLSSSAVFGMGTNQAPTPEKAPEAVANRLQQLEYPQGDSITFAIDARRLSRPVVHSDKVGTYNQKMLDMRNLIASSDIVQQALEQFQSLVTKDKAPWEDEATKIKKGVKQLVEEREKRLKELSLNIQAMERADQTKLFAPVQEDLDPEFENTMSWNSGLLEKKEVLKQYVAAQLVASLIELEDLEKVQEKVREKTIAQAPVI